MWFKAQKGHHGRDKGGRVEWGDKMRNWLGGKAGRGDWYLVSAKPLGGWVEAIYWGEKDTERRGEGSGV